MNWAPGPGYVARDLRPCLVGWHWPARLSGNAARHSAAPLLEEERRCVRVAACQWARKPTEPSGGCSSFTTTGVGTSSQDQWPKKPTSLRGIVSVLYLQPETARTLDGRAPLQCACSKMRKIHGRYIYIYI